MKNPIHKHNIRRPLKGILLLIMLLVASNLFISSISQFFIINREVDNIGEYYRSIGTIVPTDYNYNVREAQEIITGDPMIDFEDNKRQTIGIIDGLYSIERHSPSISSLEGSNLEDVIFIGEIDSVYKSRSADNIYQGSILVTKVSEILAGIPDLIDGVSSNSQIKEHHIGFLSHSLTTGEKYEYINDGVIDELFQLEPGKKYLFRAFIEPKLNEGSIVKPLYEGGPLYMELDDNGYIDWDDPEYKIIKDEIDFINENIISYNLIGTKDMTAFPEIQDSMEDYYLVEGRWLNKEDNENQNHVVIIHETIANMYEINIGDKLEIKMRDSEYGEFLASEKDHKEWRNYYTSEPTTFEVVGIFESNVMPYVLYGNMYVPDSTIPTALGRYNKKTNELVPIYPHMYSFVLKSPENESAFIEKYKDSLEELGYKLNFVINNGESFLETSKPIKQSTAISLVLFSILLILIQGFVVHIYIDGHKLNYAIERALGIPAKVSGRHLIGPLIISGSIASVIGGYIGYKNAIEKSMELLKDLIETTEISINLGLDIKYFVLFIVLSMVPFVIILLFRMNQLKNSSVIDLINNNRNKKVAKDETENESYEIVKATNISTKIDYEGEGLTETIGYAKREVKTDEKEIIKKNSQKALKRLSLNHTLRSKFTSILLIVLAGIFVFSLLWMNYLTIKNTDIIDRAYKENVIVGDIVIRDDGGIARVDVGSINGRHIENLFKTGLIQDYTAIAEMYYEELYIDRAGVVEKYELGEKDKIHFLTRKPTFVVYASNKSYNSDDAAITFTELDFVEGYSLEDFNKEYIGDYSDRSNPIIINEKGEEGFPILISNKAMEHFDLELGDKIFLKPNLKLRNSSIEAYGTIVGSFKEFDRGKDFYGYSYINQEFDLFIYPISVLEAIEGELYYNKLEFKFKPEKNKELMERKDDLRKIVSNNPFNDFPTELKLWDEELTNVIEPLEKNISLLEVLYPITFILSILIAGILSFIMVLRRILDVAILRILGVKEKEVRKSLFMENIILTLIGIIISTIIIIIITSKSYPIPLVKYVNIIGGYLLGTIVGLILAIVKVTNKKPLEMLQVKE